MWDISLIEAYWNVNWHEEQEKLCETLFNRSILKCKLSSAVIWSSVSPRLIEAYWNVNLEDYLRPVGEGECLIEAYWNVNKILKATAVAWRAFNRSILKCKSG